MAEIGLVASIFGVAAYGTKVATSLYETGDVMIHAHQQIASMAKHVSQFTTVLRHLGRVLEAEKGNCSEDLLRDIRKIKRSCKGTFKEINATLRSKRFRLLIPVRWLFKKSKAKELEARLDSEQSMLQTMIQSVTVSKLGDMQSRSKDDSKQVSGLREEIAILKTLIMENYNNVKELQRAEQSAEAEVRRAPHPPRVIPVYQGPSAPGDPENLFSSSPPPSPLSSASILSESDEEGSDPDEAVNNTKPTQPRHQAELQDADSSAGNAQTPNDFRGTAVQPLAAFDNSLEPGIHRASALLLQMVPYRPAASNPKHINQSNSLIYVTPRGSNFLDTNQKLAKEEVTKSARLLLDKWTTSGSAPVSDLLAEEEKAETAHGGRGPEISSPRAPERPWSPTRKYSDDPYDDEFTYAPPPMANPYPMPGQPPQAPFFGPFPTNSKDLSIPSHALGQPPIRFLGDEILSAIRSTRGGIVYTKRNDFIHSVYVDSIVAYTFYLVPLSLIPFNESEHWFTEIGKGWVRQEALDIFSYTYTETSSGHFCISGNLELNEIEELVRLSYQAIGRGLVERSRKIIDERGLRERVDALNRRLPNAYMNPIPASQYNQANEQWNQRSHPSAYYPGPYYNYGTKFHTQGRNDPVRPSMRTRSPQNGPTLTDPPITNSEAQLVKVDNYKEAWSASPEVRFTLPRAEATGHLKGENVPSPNPGTAARKKELKQAMEKLERLKRKRDEAMKANNNDLAADLTYYAIPEIDKRIEKLLHDEKEDEKTRSAQQQTRAPRTEVETDSESSDMEYPLESEGD